MLTPSSNTVLEPYTSRIFQTYGEEASAHFARFKVTEISLSAQSQQQFDHDTLLEAAHRLAEAKVDCIAWNGTSAAWLGMPQDETLRLRITAETGIPATSTMAAFAEAIDRLGARKLALLTPYKSEIQDRIMSQYRADGFEIVHDTRLEDPGNFSFANYPAAVIKEFALAAASAHPDAILIVCTNFRGAPIAQDVEDITGIPVIDSVSVTAWQTLRLVGLDPARVSGWGRVFAL